MRNLFTAVVGVLIAAGVGAAADPTKLHQKVAAVKIEKLRSVIAGGDVKPYIPVKWEQAREKHPDLKKEANSLDKLTDGLSKIDEAAKKLAATIGKDTSVQGAEAKRFLSQLADDKLSPNRATIPADKLLTKILRSAPAGVVGEESDAKFKLSADEFAMDPKKAYDRLKARYEAMKINTARLKDSADALETIAKRAASSQKLVDSAAKNAEDFVQRGGIKAVNTESVRNHLDGKKLSKLYADLAEDARKQKDLVKKAVDAQKKQLDAFKKFVEDAKNGFGLIL